MLLGSGALTLTRSSTSKKLPIPRFLEKRGGGREDRREKGRGREREREEGGEGRKEDERREVK